MNTKNILLNLVESFYLSRNEKIEKFKYSESPQKIKNEKISGELLEYYQHLYFKESCSFKNKFFNIELIPIISESRDPAYLGLEYFDKWQEKNYEIFAQTIGEDLIFCDVDNEKCPVYGLISGDNNIIKLSDSLFEFLDFYIKLTKLQTLEFNREIRDGSGLKKAFIEKVYELITQDFSGEAKSGLIEFTLSGTLHIIGIKE